MKSLRDGQERWMRLIDHPLLVDTSRPSGYDRSRSVRLGYEVSIQCPFLAASCEDYRAAIGGQPANERTSWPTKGAGCLDNQRLSRIG
jgi:hypothetical protein